jgi:hypothetical protein
MPGGNNGARVKERQAWCTETTWQTRAGGLLTRGSLARQATSWLGQGACEGQRSQITMLESGGRRKAPAPFGAGERLHSPTYRYPRRDNSAVNLFAKDRR